MVIDRDRHDHGVVEERMSSGSGIGGQAGRSMDLGPGPPRSPWRGTAVGVVVAVLAVVVAFGIVVPFVLSLFALAVPIALVVGGAGVVSGRWGRGLGALGRVAGWVAIVIGGALLLDAVIDPLWTLVRLVLASALVVLIVAGALYGWRAISR